MKTIKTILMTGVLAVVVAGAATAQAQIMPVNVPAPINVGATGQYKEGALRVGGTGTPTAGAKLDVIGVTSTYGLGNFGTSQLRGYVQIGVPYTGGSGAAKDTFLASAVSPVLSGNIFAAVSNFFKTQTAEAQSAPGTMLDVYGGASRFYGNLNVYTPAENGSLGRIGIGIGDPDNKLHVHSTNTRAGITVSTGVAEWAQIYQPYNVNQLRIGHNTSTNTTDIMTFDFNTNRVGIGTTSPQARLSVAAPIGDAAVQLENGHLAFATNGTKKWGIMNSGDGSLSISQNASTAGNNHIRINSQGNVGIGTIQDDNLYRLNVNGAAKTGNLNVTGALQVHTINPVNKGKALYLNTCNVDSLGQHTVTDHDGRKNSANQLVCNNEFLGYAIKEY